MQTHRYFSLGAWAGALMLLPFTAYSIELIDRALPASARPAASSDVHVFVHLDMPSVAEYCVNSIRDGNPEPSAAAQRAHASAVDAYQRGVRSELTALGARVVSTLRVGANGFRVKMDAGRLDDLRAIAGVRSVVRVTEHRPTLARSVPWIGADAIQALGVDGKGVTIAVIDTGIDYLHAHFGGSGDPADYAGNDPNVIEPGTFPTVKVIGGFDLAGPIYDASCGDPTVCSDIPAPDPDPLDVNGHGSHVAGIAAGLGVPGQIGVGVAPGAKLYALKVFGDIAGSTDLTSDAIELALDPNGDGDTSDRVDVINMSLGSDFGDPEEPSTVASQNAAELGVIVAISAGNDGAIPYIVGGPSVAPAAISVAASLSGGDTLAIEASGDVSGLFEAVEGTSPVRLADGSVSGNLMQPSDSANIQGCNPIGDDLTGAVALVQRGTCSFNQKFVNAQDAGAVGVVVWNDGTDPTRIAPIVMGAVTDGAIPGVMVSFFAGDQLSAGLTGGDAIAALLDESLQTPTLFGDTLAGFTSQGPSHGGSGFKPEVSAPGSAVVSTGVGTGDGPGTLSGTSMAAPHVAGLGALLRQAKPSLDQSAIKAIILNSSVPAVGAGTIGPAPRLALQGTGVIRADQAFALTSFAKPGGVSFGRLNPFVPITRQQQSVVHNMSASPQVFTVTHEPNQTFAGVTVECPSRVIVGPHGTRSFRIRLAFDPTVGPFDDAFHSQTEVDGWCVLNNGSAPPMRVGYLAVVDPASRMNAKGGKGQVTISNTAGNLGWAEGFTEVGRGDELLEDVPNSFAAMGVRTADFAAPGDLVQLGFASQRSWETFAALEIDWFIDVDEDGVDDFVLVVADFFGDGMPITAIFPQGAALFTSVLDLNDHSGYATFIGPQDSPFGVFGFLPPGDTTFDYTAVFFDIRDTSMVGLQTGSVDLAQQLVPDANSFGLFPGETASVNVAGKGRMLWLFPNNSGQPRRQVDVVNVSQ